VLYLDGRPTRYYRDKVTDDDVRRFGIERGSPKSQALLETMAVLIGVRAWRGFLGRQRWTVTVRSDSQAALGAALRLRSPDPRMNAVVRELALDLAEGLYQTDFWEHLPGDDNVLADMLSRWEQPGACTTLPPELAALERTAVAPRGDSW